MADEQKPDRKNLTFEQAENAAHLPRQLALKEVSKELSAILWNIIHDSIGIGGNRNDQPGSRPVAEPWLTMLSVHWVLVLHRPIDEFDSNYETQIFRCKEIILSDDYLKVFGFIQWVLRRPECPFNLQREIDAVLKGTKAAYRIFDGDTIAPCAGEQEGHTLELAFADLAATEFNGARKHLKNAAEAATKGDWAGCVRDAMHAVESTARSIVPETNELGPALRALEKSGYLHGSLKKGLGALYGFTSDEKGIRHPLLDEGDAQVDQVDALFMLGACAAFVSYLINKGRISGIIKP